MQEVANGVKRMAVFFLPIWVSWTVVTKGPNQGRGRELEHPSSRRLMICPGRIQVPEVNLISSTQARISGEDPSQGVERWPPPPPPSILNTSVRAGVLKRPEVFAGPLHPALPLVALQAFYS